MSFSYSDNYKDPNAYSSYHQGAGRDSNNEYTRLSQVISKNVQSIAKNVADIQNKISRIGTNQDSPQLRDQLHQVQHYTNQLAKETGKYLRDLTALPAPASQSEQRERKMHRSRLTNEFTATLNNFQAAQRQAAEKEKASVRRARAASGSMMDPFMDERRSDDMLTAERRPLADSPTQQMVIQMEQDVDLELLHEREQAIRQLESDIMDVNQIFKDVGMLVHEQGEVIDSIEANVERAEVHVEQGSAQLAKAKDYQKRSRRKTCIIISIAVGLILILILIIYFSTN